MKWDIKADRPIYLQLVEQIQLGIIAGQFPIGTKLPSVREFAAEVGVNPNTMQRALAVLETEGLIYAQRTSGRFITEDEEKIMELKTALANEQIQAFLKHMEKIGYSIQDVIKLIQNQQKEV